MEPQDFTRFTQDWDDKRLYKEKSCDNLVLISWFLINTKLLPIWYNKQKNQLVKNLI